MICNNIFFLLMYWMENAIKTEKMKQQGLNFLPK